MPYLIILKKKQQNLKLSSAANYKWCFMVKIYFCSMFQEIYEVKKTEDKILSGNVCRHDLGAQAPMNGASYYDGRNHMFAAGMDDECHLFSLKYKVVSPTKQGMLCITFIVPPTFLRWYIAFDLSVHPSYIQC